MSGGVESPYIEKLQIIDENVFDQAQFILKQRSSKNEENSKLRELLRAVHCCLETYIVLIVDRRWYQQAMSIDIIGKTEVSIKCADKDIYVQTRL